MKITDIYIRRISAECSTSGIRAFSDTSIVTATDIYPDYVRHSSAARVVVTPFPDKDGRLVVTHDYLMIETDEGITGIVGPVTFPGVSYYILNSIKYTLMGQDPMRIEYLQDLMYRVGLDNGMGDYERAMSHAEAALWDIKCKKLGVPLYELLGGKVRDCAPVYENIACVPHNEEMVRITKEFAEEGILGVKIYSKYGPAQGKSGIRKTREILEKVRTGAGKDTLIALEGICCWNYEYALELGKAIADLDIAWLEEPSLPDRMDDYAQLVKNCPVPISAGEHSIRKWGFRKMMEMKAVNIYQPEATWDGGILETMKIITLAEAFNCKVYPHGCVPNLGAHIMAATSPEVCPMTEYILNINDAAQYFMKYPTKPVHGMVMPPEVPGIGCDIDESKVEKSEILA